MMQFAIIQCGKASFTEPVRNSFIVRAFNTLTHKGEPNWTINFDKEAFPAGATGQKALPASVITDPLGIGFGTMWTGDKVGGYTYRAVCPSCLMNPQVWCSVLAALPPKVEAVPLDEGPEAGDPTVTPMLRISNVYYRNDQVSFTTHDAEKTVTLEAELRPTDTALARNIAWEVKDSPRDAPDMDSGDPDDPAPGESTAFDVTAPPASKGRLLPLKYMIQASVETPKGLVRSYPRHIKQDDIDKCRQEYIDYIVAAGKALNLSEVPRSRFTPGVDSEFLEEKDRGDCYAYIYPQARAMEVFSLRALHQGAFGIKVKSGYRSPRVNYRTPNASDKSRHMYGDAVDIVPTPKTNATKNTLWPTVGAPKMLEKSVGPNILLKYRTSGEILTIRNYDFNTKYNPKDTNGDGFTDTVQDGDMILQIKNMSWDTLKKYLADSNGDGISNIVENAEWMHLGE